MIPIADDRDSVQCFRNSGIVKIPRKILRKSSVPAMVSQREVVPSKRKISCPVIREAVQSQASCQLEVTEDFCDRKEIAPNYEIQEALKKVRQGLLKCFIGEISPNQLGLQL